MSWNKTVPPFCQKVLKNELRNLISSKKMNISVFVRIYGYEQVLFDYWKHGYGFHSISVATHRAFLRIS